jgi:hypothetical protein
MAYVNRTAHITAALVISKETDVLDQAAQHVLDHVRTAAEQHRDTGNYIEHLGIDTTRTARGVVDRLVVADDDEAQLIEFGGIVKSTGRVIPGLHIMREGLNRS